MQGDRLPQHQASGQHLRQQDRLVLNQRTPALCAPAAGSCICFPGSEDWTYPPGPTVPHRAPLSHLSQAGGRDLASAHGTHNRSTREHVRADERHQGHHAAQDWGNTPGPRAGSVSTSVPPPPTVSRPECSPALPQLHLGRTPVGSHPCAQQSCPDWSRGSCNPSCADSGRRAVTAVHSRGPGGQSPGESSD